MGQVNSEIKDDLLEAIAEEAYIFAYPMLEHYKRLYLQAIKPNSPDFRASMGQFFTGQNHATGKDQMLEVGVRLFLKTEPWVLRVPANLENRCYSVQLIDSYTHNFGYISTRTTGGMAAGHYLLAGPGWNSAKPAGIDRVFVSEGNLVFALGRVAVQSSSDLPSAIAFAAQYQAMPLSQFLGQTTAPRGTVTRFPAYDSSKATANFIPIFNFLLGQLQLHASETALIEKFEQIGIGANRKFDRDGLSLPLQAALDAGIARAIQKIDTAAQTLGEMRHGWQVITTGFGNRERMQGRYLTRAAAAQHALYGNDAEEELVLNATVDADGEALDGSTHIYMLQFRKDELPAAQAFWSMTLHQFPDLRLVDNPIERHSIGDRTPGLQYEADGGLTLYLQAESPGGDRMSNWLPAPKGLFSSTLRIYIPAARALTPHYCVPPIRKANC